MIKVTTESGTVYIIDEDKQKIQRVPRTDTELSSMLRGFTNIGEFQPYTSISKLEVGKSLHVVYPNEQLWSISTPITEIDYKYEEVKS